MAVAIRGEDRDDGIPKTTACPERRGEVIWDDLSIALEVKLSL